MTRPKRPYHHGDLRRALIARAVRLVEEAGAERFSLREAARLVGVSANAAYRHFADKGELLTAVAEVGFDRMERRLQKALSSVDGPGTSALERVKALGRGYVDFAVDHPELLRVMFGSSGFSSLEKGGPPKPPAYALLGAALDELARVGVLPPDRRPGAELKAWTVVHGFASLVVQGVGAVQGTAARTDALEAVLEFAVTGLCGRLPPPRGPEGAGPR
jgi:AcrR family transcriptional regulator